MKIKDFKDFRGCPEEIPDELINERRLASSHLASVRRVNENGGMTLAEIIENTSKFKLLTADEAITYIKGLISGLSNLQEKEHTKD